MIALLLAIQAAAAPVPPAESPDDVVVVARLNQARDALKDCLERKCDPKADATASIAYAREQFMIGDYVGSRTTLEKARGRNKHYAAKIPVELSWVHHGLGTAQDVTGFVLAKKLSMISMVEALKAGLPAADARILLAKLEIGDAYARATRPDEAIGVYQSVAARAKAQRQYTVMGLALYRRAALLASMAAIDSIYRPGASLAVRGIQETTEPELRPFRNATRLFDAQFIKDAGRRDAAIDAAIATMEPVSAAAPISLFAPRLDFSDQTQEAGGGLASFGGTASTSGDRLQGPIDGDQTYWVDIAYSVAADGRVADLTVLRQSPDMRKDWTRRLEKAIVARRFMPMRLAPGATPPRLRERYLFVSDVTFDRGMAMRSPIRRLVKVDLDTLPEHPDASDVYTVPPL